MKWPALALVLAATVLVGCGSSGGSSSTSPATAKAPSRAAESRYSREAEAVCTQMAAEAAKAGKRALAIDPTRYQNTLEYTTEALVAPALPIVERNARQLRAIEAKSADPQLGGFVNLFDPILSLLVDRVEAGHKRDTEESHELELQLIELSEIQRALAMEAGLTACEVDFVGSFASARPST